MRVCGDRVLGAAHAPCARGLSHATNRVGRMPAPCWYKLRALDVCSPSSLCGSCPSFHAGVGLDSFRGRQPMQGPGPEPEAAASMFAEEPWRSLVTTVVHALRLPEPAPAPSTGPSLRPARGVSQQTVRRLRDCLQVGKMCIVLWHHVVCEGRSDAVLTPLLWRCRHLWPSPKTTSPRPT
jgi:hypothetical protein